MTPKAVVTAQPNSGAIRISKSSGITLKKSIDWLEHIYGFYLDEPIRTAVIYYKSVSTYKPDYYIEYLENSPWIHFPYEKYEGISVQDLKK